jgi:serine/threonine protein kinase
MSRIANLSAADIARYLPQLVERFELLDAGPVAPPGGFGAVWRARDRLLQQNVAIKISDTDLSSEVMFCRSIDGHTVRVYDYVQQNGWDAYAMELLAAPWQTISTLISEHNGRNMLQRYFDAIEVIDGVLAALEHIHGVPYSRGGRHVHADIQPRNVFVWWTPKTNRREVFRLPHGRDLIKIIDLGLTVSKGDPHAGYHPNYSYPLRDVAHQGHDLYSVAIVFLELVTGALPSHHVMGHRARIASHVAANSSGSSAIDLIAVEFATRAARAASNTALTATKLREHLSDAVFDVPHLRLLVLREIHRQQTGPLKKTEMAEFLFPLYADNLGWTNRTDGRLEWIQGDVLDMAQEGLLVRDGHHYHL